MLGNDILYCQSCKCGKGIEMLGNGIYLAIGIYVFINKFEPKKYFEFPLSVEHVAIWFLSLVTGI